ncbi:MAG: anhydro-N-acetylmuramic acid kinase [Lysobacterales bacterium]|nr:MAG: anhydro-N-acetylmuramic acid kinase [Xanthomonadales bacterium]
MSAPLFLGAISGTSVDGLDLALIEGGEHPRIRNGRTYPLPQTLRTTLLRLGQPGGDDLDTLGAADTALGRFIGSTALRFLEDCGVVAADIVAFGTHGQTVRHRPNGPDPFTLQIGDPNTIAELTGITTVADFRRRDMAAGGQGAPLVPPFHRALFHVEGEDRAILNIGGIANLTLLPGNPEQAVTGFDTGPGNGLMDAWIVDRRQTPFDTDGAWGLTGRVDRGLLGLLCQDPFFAAAPPKSTGREYFNLAWLDQHLGASAIADADVQATLRVLTARTIRDALEHWGPTAARVIVCGGGRLNQALLAELLQQFDQPVDTAEDHGVDGDSIEAAAFAWLAYRTINGLPGNEPAVTGAGQRRVLGAIYRG